MGTAALSERDKEPEIPSGKTAGPNLYDKEWNKEKIREYVEDKLTNESSSIFMKLYNKEHCESRKEVVDVICENIWNVKMNNYP